MTVEGLGLSFRYQGGGGHEGWHCGGSRRNLRGEVQSKVLEEMHGFLFWLAGSIVDIYPRDCQARTDLCQ